MSEKPNCYECIHRRSVPGDAHSSCAHPAAAAISSDLFGGIVDMLMKPEKVMEAAGTLGIQAQRHGVLMGWFWWPANFDPVWLERCNGFTPASAPAPTQESPHG